MKLRNDTPTATTTVRSRTFEGTAITLDFMFSEGQLVRTQCDRPDGDSIDVAGMCDGDLNEPHCARRMLRTAIANQETDMLARDVYALADWALEALAVECGEDGEEYAWFFGTLGYRCGDIGEDLGDHLNALERPNWPAEKAARESVEADTAALADSAPQLLAAIRWMVETEMFLPDHPARQAAFKAARVLLAQQPAPRWEVALNGENVWSDTDESGTSTPVTFETEAEADAALLEFFADCKADFEAGHLSDNCTDEGYSVRQVR